jgi:hypothetical protein
MATKRRNPRVRFRVGDSVSVPWFYGRRLQGVVKQIRGDGQMVIDSPTSGLHAVPARQGRKLKTKLKGAVGRLVNPGPSAIPARLVVDIDIGDSTRGYQHARLHLTGRKKRYIERPQGWARLFSSVLPQLRGLGPGEYTLTATTPSGDQLPARVTIASYQRNPAGPSAIPGRWTPATVSRKGGQIQIRMGGR